MDQQALANAIQALIQVQAGQNQGLVTTSQSAQPKIPPHGTRPNVLGFMNGGSNANGGGQQNQNGGQNQYGKKNNNNAGRTHPYQGDGGMKAAIRELTNVVKQCHAEHMDKISGLEKALQELVAMQGKAEKKEGDEKKKELNEMEGGNPQIN